HRRQRRAVAAHLRPARRHGERPAGHPVHLDPVLRNLLRPIAARAVARVAPVAAGGSVSAGTDTAVSTGAAGVALAVLGGAIRISTPFLFVSLGECLTEKSGRVNLGLE